MSAERMDTALCEALVGRICGGDEAVWRELVEHLWPHWIGMVKGSRHMGSMAKNEDHVHNVVAELVDKLGTDGGRAVTRYPAWRAENPGKTFADWMRIVVSFTVKDYVRSVLGRGASGPSEDGLPSIKRLLNEFAASPASEEAFGSNRPAMTAAQTARQLLDFAEAHLPPDQRAALSLWLDGAAFEEIEASLGAGGDAGRKLVRAAVASIRRKFAAGSVEGEK